MMSQFWYFGRVVAYRRLSLTRGGRTGRFDCTLKDALKSCQMFRGRGLAEVCSKPIKAPNFDQQVVFFYLDISAEYDWI